MKTFIHGIAGSTRAVLLGGAAAVSLLVPTLASAQEAQPAPEAEPVEEEAQPATDMPTQGAGAASGNEIVVTATKREQTLQDVPVAVTVTTAETIERAHIRDIRDLSTVVPSLRVNQLQSVANTNFYIRGFGNGANNAGIEPSVGLFVDGVYRSRSASMVTDLPDVQRIEVLRGPQSTLFGKNASAGVISIVTKEPQFDFGGNVEASYGNYNAVVLKGVVTGPITDDIAASLAGSFNRRDGYLHDLATGDDTNERNRWFLRGQVLIKPTNELKIRLIGDYNKIDELCCGVVNVRSSAATTAIKLLGGQVNDPSDPFGDVVYNNLNSTNNIENWGLSGQVDYSLGPLKLTSITSYRKTDAVTDQDSDFTSAELLGHNSQDLRIKTFTQELRLSTNLEGPLNFLFGGFYFNEHIDQNNQVLLGRQFRPYADLLIRNASGNLLNVASTEALFGALSGNPSLYTNQFFLEGQGLTENYTLKDESFSVYGQVDLEIAKGLTLTGGLAYNHDSKNFATNVTSSDVFSSVDIPALVGTTSPLLALKELQFLPPFMNVPNAVEPGKVSDGHVSYTARLAYDLTRTVNVYASYATGWKAASVNLSRDSRPTEADLVTINQLGIGVPNLTSGSRYAGPEKSEVFEAGFKGNWGLATANVAVFKQIIDGFQSNIFTGTGFFLANAGKQSSFGIEFEGTVNPTPPLTLSLSMTYLDPKYDSFMLSGIGDLSGTTPAGISPLSVTFGAQYDHDLGNGDHLILRGDFHYEAPFELVEGLPGLIVKDPITGAILDTTAALAAAREFKQDVNQLDASLTYVMANGLELSIWGRNLTDDRYLLNLFDSPAQSGSLSAYPSEPRTYGVSARFRW
jgi:outer membrane receptor protein involved in Fe transport